MLSHSNNCAIDGNQTLMSDQKNCKLTFMIGHMVTYWIRHYATSRKVADSVPDEVNVIDLPNPSVRTRP
jgi:hypothetical protein